MKGKFKLLGHIGLGLFLVCALMLAVVPVAPVAQAATAVTNVWVEFPAEDAAGENPGTYNIAAAVGLYRIHFKATTALVRGVDTIVVQFPDGVDTTMGPSDNAFTLGSGCSTAGNFDIMVDPYAAGKTYSDYYDCTAAAYGGYRLTVTIGVDIAAGSEVWLLIDDAASTVTGGATSTSPYKVKVHTSKDTTPVLSKGFYLGTLADQVTTTASSVSPTSAGATNVEYTFTFTPGTALVTADTITVTFPYGTTVPSSMAASGITVYDATAETGGWFTCGVSPTIDTDLRTVKVTTPHAIGTTAGAKIKFATTCGISNPTRAYASWGAVTTKSRVGFINTSNDRQNTPLYAYEVTYDAATKVDFDYTASPDLVTGLSDKYTMINMYSSPLYLQVEDQYGNVVSGGSYSTAQVTLSSSSGSGNFYNITTDVYTLISTTQTLVSGKKSIYYKDTTAGTYTLTASYSGLTSATWTMQVCGGVSLYDRYDNLINTYKPTAGTPVEEGDLDATPVSHKGGYYVQQAINAAAAYDKVVLGDGHYEVDDTSSNQISVGEEYVTLKSLNGADYTTIDGSTLTDSAPEYGTVIDVSAANVTIDGLTIKNNKSGDHDQRGIYIRYGGFTIQNNKFIDVPSDNILLSAGAVTSGTITNNTITGIGRGHYFDRNGILLECSASCSGVKITNNTISGIGGSASSGIRVARLGGTVTEITVQGNTVSDSFCGISLYGTVTGMTGTKAIANNTITGCVWGVKTSGTADVAFDLVKNTITNSKLYGIYLYGTTLTSTLTFKYNDISGNGSWGIYNINTAGVDVVAKYNYWGDATGPGAGTGTYASTTARGSGDNVSCEVTFSPWLYKPLADVVADNASYQAVEMKLIAGWNTLSTPVQLIAAADTIDELIPSGMTIGYYYDATGWHQITTGYVLNPCDAVYVKMSAITYVLFKFDAGAWTMPSKALAAGWNLVSLASLNASMQADDAVASVYKTAANLPGYSQVISPSLNPGQTDIYGVSGAAWSISCAQHGADLSTELMRPGLGYWIYMQNAATLAGFEITPIAPAFGL